MTERCPDGKHVKGRTDECDRCGARLEPRDAPSPFDEPFTGEGLETGGPPPLAVILVAIGLGVLAYLVLR